eukprot:CAMPEP_0180828986 /NCGR_PEP_ID=MMETSP1038_2-20121128/74983_1 /TAXON_ID=632150 /ORGANISM="Azadinium spinosum, Strain 3D9" /LENGTH=114 /DNA_ID=CAMNT_0022871925 /DNA_START=48 /DNA_END=388 /DNA_ORIENTATION=+
MASSVEDRLTEECPQQCAARRRSEPRIRHLNTLRCNLATPAKDDFGGIARGGLRKRLPRIGNRLQPPRLLKTACVGAALGRMAQLPERTTERRVLRLQRDKAAALAPTPSSSRT